MSDDVTHLGIVNLPDHPDEQFCGCGMALDENGHCIDCFEPPEPEPDAEEGTDEEADEAQAKWEAWTFRG